MAYATLTDLKPVLQVPLVPDPARDAAWLAYLTVGADALNLYCRRTFTPTTSTITLDAPARIDLAVPDLQSVTSLTAYGTVLVAGTDYRLLTDDLIAPYRRTTWAPHFTRIRRIAALTGRPAVWQAYSGGASDVGAITLALQESYSATVPPAITLANVLIAAQLWNAHLQHFDDPALVQTGAGLIEGNPALVNLLVPYRAEAAA